MTNELRTRLSSWGSLVALEEVVHQIHPLAFRAVGANEDYRQGGSAPVWMATTDLSCV